MVDNQRPKLVGAFIRQRREGLGLSQRALGLIFEPAVTTQFISNVERGVTPLPPAHVPTLCKALQVSEGEIMSLLEQEYTLKLSGRLRRDGGATLVNTQSANALSISTHDYSFMRSLYEAFRQADASTRQAFFSVCESILKVPQSGLTAA